MQKPGNNRGYCEYQGDYRADIKSISVTVRAVCLKQAGEIQFLLSQDPIVANQDPGDGAHQAGVTYQPGENVCAHRVHQLPGHHGYTDQSSDQPAEDVRDSFGIEIGEIV